MELQIVGKNTEISQPIQDYVQKKIGKLARYLRNIAEAEVEIYEEKTKSPQHRFTVQVTLNSKGTLLRGEEKGENIFVAVDAVAEVLARQIERYRGKLYKRGRGVSLARQTPGIEGAIIGSEAQVLPKVVRVKHFAVKPMSVAEAAEQMELLGHDFFLFVNADNDALNLLYRRRNGDYGLIEPELA
ncbi:MAG TPA: ribosome-associated translation inhibitor RaiA [Dehalococcoidia bacterium]|nr:ribosome-associated translation inhibitor RaiA [Dehalococcoidia bacterium]